jgi:hypothetical protein
MTRFGRVRRRPDGWASPHERARMRAAQRMDWPLHPDEAAWLDRHLEECDACRAAVADYEATRIELRGLRGTEPAPPRDLWARTAAAIEQGPTRRGRASAGRGPRLSPAPLGALSGLLVVAIVLGATLLSRPTIEPAPPATPSAVPTPGAASPTSPRPTPIIVGAGEVSWVRSGPDGVWGLTRARVDQVCPPAGRPDCAPIDGDTESRPVVLLANPRSVIGSPRDGQAIVVGSSGTSGDTVYVVALPTPAPEPSPSAEPPPTTEPTTEPTATPKPTAEPTTEPTTEPTATSKPTAEPTVEPTAESTVEPTPDITAEPTTEPVIAIATDITVVGESAAYSPDGEWFAFTARPADGSRGPDIHIWRVGDESARPVTTDHASVMASWLGDRILGSRIVDDEDAADGAVRSVTFLLDPTTGEETILEDVGWRPTVDPSGMLVVAWVGSLIVSDDGHAWHAGSGSLEIRPWSVDGTGSDDGQVIATGPLADFDVRWDPTGRWLAAWIADPVDPLIGRLTLYRMDLDDGLIVQPEGAPRDVPALPGYSLGDGRLAWVSPSGQDGHGSRVLVVAWSADDVGLTESAPGEDLVVVR